MKHILFIYLILLARIFPVSGQTSILSPDEFLGYELGDQFTRHHKIVEYFSRLSEESAKIKLVEYGKTYEDRPLFLVYISNPKTIKEVDSFRKDNLKRTALMEGDPELDPKAIVWLSYNVHGNEASSSEASMLTTYELVSSNDPKITAWLENTIIIIDPCLNPDGHDRYVNWFRQYQIKNGIPSYLSSDHQEPWPGGRMNHFLFDNNRDWSWATQKETRARLKIYNEWLPHIHVDFHEQGHNNPYYFAPAAQPYHELITNWQRQFQGTIGKNNAKYFDENYWLYFTKEFFDLFYPGYGDTYPTFNGAIGMTYEQAGGGRAGLAVETEIEDTLTLADRIHHHHITGLATVETASTHVDELIVNFERYFQDATNNPKGKYKTFIIRPDTKNTKVRDFLDLLDRHQIQYGTGSSRKPVMAYDYISGREREINITSGDILISSRQSKSILAQVLLEPEARIVDSMTYDITAWSLPYAYGFKSFATKELVTVTPTDVEPDEKTNMEVNDGSYAYLFERESLQAYKLLSILLQKGIKVRTNLKSINVDGNLYPAGTMIITRADNMKLNEGLEKILITGSMQTGIKFVRLSSGMVSEGVDLGSSKVALIKNPKVAILTGNGVSPYSFGESWHFLEEVLEFPHMHLRTDYFHIALLKEIDVLIIPSGNYSKIISEENLKEINQWINNGGRVVAVEGALSSFRDKDSFKLKSFYSDDEKKKFKEMDKKDDPLKRFEDNDRMRLEDVIRGSIFRVKLDNSHPLAFGLDNYYTLKKSRTRYAYLEKGWNIGVIQDPGDKISGFSGNQTRDNLTKSLVFGVEPIGRGEIVYFVDNPLFRSFWYNGKMLFANALFMP
ncbi:M14 family metallopeptidase [Bacteroidota bacterium]